MTIKKKLAEKRKICASENKIILQEKQILYREKNIDQIKVREKQYKDAHKEQIKEYYQNKKEYLHEKIQCKCSLFSSRQHISRHQKTQKHIQLLEALSNCKDSVEILFNLLSTLLHG